MKGRKHWLFSFLLILLAGGGLATKVVSDRKRESGTPASAPKGDLSEQARKSPRDSRHVDGDPERLIRIRAWLGAKDQKASQKLRREMLATINGLSLEAIQELLGDLNALADVRDQGSDGVHYDIFPLRLHLRGMLWQRFGELAPDLALARAFPDEKITREPGVQIEDILYGVAKNDAGKAFEAWFPHFAASNTGGLDRPAEETFLSQFSSFPENLFEQWSKTSPELSVAAIERLSGPLQEIAYLGHLYGLDDGTDWKRETERISRLFPDQSVRKIGYGNLASALAGRWAVEDPDAAFAWINTLEKADSDPYFTGYKQVISSWMREEPAEATAWLTKWDPPAGFDKDSLYRSILEGYGSKNVPVSLGALELIPTQTIRDETIRQIITKPWQDKEVLRMWEKSPLLSPQVRLDVTRAIQERDASGTGWIE